MANIKRNDLTELFPNLISVLEAYGRTLVDRYRQGLKDGDHIATGNLYQSVNSEVTLDGQSFIVEFRMPLYGEFLEKGTGIYEQANQLTYNEWNKKIDEAITKDLELNLAEIIQTLNQKGRTRKRR